MHRQHRPSNSSSLANRLTIFPAAVLTLLLAACSSSGGNDAATQTLVAKVAITQTGLILTAQGDSRQLSATAFDVQGRIVDVPIVWSSTQPTAVAVDATGRVTATTANGSSQIVAEVLGVRSAPLLVAVTPPAAGALLLTDAQIIGAPFEVDPSAEPSFANTYRVALRGATPPPVGSLLINTESKAVGGRVVAVETSSDGTITVTLGLVPVREMFPDLNLQETINMAQAEVVLNSEIAAAYDMQRSGNTFTFTPKSAAAGIGVVRSAPQAPASIPTVPPFSECESTVTGQNLLPIQLVNPPVLSVTQTFGLDLVYSSVAGLERFVVNGEVDATYDGSVTVAAAFEGEITCEAELFSVRIPIGGPLSLFVGGLIPVKAGFEIGGKLTVASASIGVKAEANAEASLGIACPNGAGCEFVRTLTGDGDADPVWHLPSLVGDLRFEPGISAFGKIELAIGNPFLRTLRFKAFEAQMGPKLEGSFALMGSQLADTEYKSDYKALFESSAGVGIDLGDALELFGLTSITALELVGTIEIANSPTGGVTADRDSFEAGDSVTFTVQLDPGRVNFYPALGPYNVSEILLVRQTTAGFTPTEIDRISAASGQTEFEFSFTASDDGTADQFAAFVVTTLLPFDLFALEIGVATPPPAFLMDVELASTIPEATGSPIVVTITTPNDQGGFDPAPNLLVDLLATCAGVSPPSGTTSAEGTVTATITPDSGCPSVSVTVEARVDAASAPVAEQTVTASVGSSSPPPPPPPPPSDEFTGTYVGTWTNCNADGFCGVLENERVTVSAAGPFTGFPYNHLFTYFGSFRACSGAVTGAFVTIGAGGFFTGEEANCPPTLPTLGPEFGMTGTITASTIEIAYDLPNAPGSSITFQGIRELPP